MSIEIKDTGWVNLVHVADGAARTERKVDAFSLLNRMTEACLTVQKERGEESIEQQNVAVTRVLEAEGFANVSQHWADAVYFKLKEHVGELKKRRWVGHCRRCKTFGFLVPAVGFDALAPGYVEGEFATAEHIIEAEERLKAGGVTDDEFFDLVLTVSGEREVAEQATYQRMRNKLLAM